GKLGHVRKKVTAPAGKGKAASPRKNVGDVKKRKTHIALLDFPVFQHAVKRAAPADVHPQLCTLAQTVPTGEDWLHEVKFDGYRMIAFVNRRKCRLVSRNGIAYTAKFPAVADSCAALGHDLIVDGEIVALGSDGKSSFQTLQNMLRDGSGTQA